MSTYNNSSQQEYQGVSGPTTSYTTLGNYNYGQCPSAPYAATVTQPVLKVLPAFGGNGAQTFQEQQAPINNVNSW